MAEDAASESKLWEGKNSWTWGASSLPMDTVEVSDDSKADAKAALIVISCVVLMAIHFVSGWTFEF